MCAYFIEMNELVLGFFIIDREGGWGAVGPLKNPECEAENLSLKLNKIAKDIFVPS